MALNPTFPPSIIIPTIDIGPYLHESSPSAISEIVSQIREACVSSGFFQITGHGISPTLQSAVLAAAEALFSLSSEEKSKLSVDLVGTRDRGYEVIGSQTLQAGTRPDLKEGFYIGRGDETGLSTTPHRNFDGPNVWPPSSLLPDERFRLPLLEYHTKMCGLARAVIQMLADGMEYNGNIFDKFCTDPVAVLRLLHYPPQKSTDPLQLGAGAHTDFGAITLLLQDDKGGLQVLNHATNAWVDVVPNDNAYVVNVGDMLSLWTKQEYRSSIHRVINLGGKDRYSIPFFFNGNLDCPLEPLCGTSVAGRIITVEDHLIERFSATYKGPN